MNALLQVRLLRAMRKRPQYQPMPKVGERTTDPVALGVRISIARWHAAGCLKILEGGK